MNRIENSKSYSGAELDNVFFRPMVEGDDARGLGIRVLYNMPVPTTLHFWRRSGEILHQYKAAGWVGSETADRLRKTIELHRVKAEAGYSADEYFSLVYDSLSRSSLGRVEDLSGTELEEAETAMFRDAIQESVRATMWLGKSDRDAGLNTFDGFICRILADVESETDMAVSTYELVTADNVVETLQGVWDGASLALKDLKSEGQLAFFVTTDIYQAYEESLEKPDLEAAYIARRDGTEALTYRGIPLVDVKVSDYILKYADLATSFVLLTDRRNLALALNTSDFPGTEVRMWYNPDLMENRQRAGFMAGCDYLLPELVSMGYAE